MNKKELEDKIKQLIELNKDMTIEHRISKNEVEDEEKLKELRKEKVNIDTYFNRVSYMEFYFSSKKIIMKYWPDLWDEFDYFYKNHLPAQYSDDFDKMTSFNTGIRHFLISGWVVTNKAKQSIWMENINKMLISQRGILEYILKNVDESKIIDIDGNKVYEDSVDSIKFLISKGFYRSSGAIASVLIEGIIKENARLLNYKINKKSDKSTNSHLDFLKKKGSISDSEKKRIDSYLSIRNNIISHKNGIEEGSVSKATADDMLEGLLFVRKTFTII